MPPLFRIQKVTDHCFAAIARPIPRLNCNAAIVVTSEWIMVVDTHSRPSAARALLGQINSEWPGVPVRYVVNTHFHWDHVQGNLAYLTRFGSVDVISTGPTLDLMRREGIRRLSDTIDAAESELSSLRVGVESGSAHRFDRDTQDRIGGLLRYCGEMRESQLVLPTFTFDESHVVRSRELTVHLLAPGRGHTAGDLIVYVPTEGVVVTGDLLQGTVPWLGDAYPDEWISALDVLSDLQFDRIIPGHGTVQSGTWLLSFVQNYLRCASEVVLKALEGGTGIETADALFTAELDRRFGSSAVREALLAQMECVFGPSGEMRLSEAIGQSLRDTWNYYSGMSRYSCRIAPETGDYAPS